MSRHIKITNNTRGSFRRAGLRFPARAQGSVILAIQDLTDEQKDTLENEPRLEIEPYEPPEAETTKKTGPPKSGKVKTAT